MARPAETILYLSPEGVTVVSTAMHLFRDALAASDELTDLARGQWLFQIDEIEAELRASVGS